MKYFISTSHEFIYYILELNGNARVNALGITAFCYHNKKYAKKWRDKILDKIKSNGDVPDDIIQEAIEELNKIYHGMIGR